LVFVLLIFCLARIYFNYSGAVDPRVIGIAPIVLDALGVQAFMHRQFTMYGGFTFALRDYWKLNVTMMVDTDNATLMFSIIDPLAYADRLTLPKMMITAGGDEFQMPDDQRFWASKMVGEMNFLVVKNAEHSEATGILELLPAACAFGEALVAGRPRWVFVF
jgi:PhoPQ-activated pathogenicity-related protein